MQSSLTFPIWDALVRQKVGALSHVSPPPALPFSPHHSHFGMAGQYVLLQFDSDPFSHTYEDLESRQAFTIGKAVQTQPLIIKISRESQWSQQHPDIMGPSTAHVYFGPEKSIGYLIYGNGKEVPLAQLLHRKKDGSSSRYFTTLCGKELKWKITPQKMECIDGRTTIATWEMSQPEDVFSARLTIKHAGLRIVTELLTTLTLNRMAMALGW